MAVERGTVRLGLLLLSAGVLVQTAFFAMLLRQARLMQQAAAAGLPAPPEPSVVLTSALTYGAILLVCVGLHQAVWAPPRNARLYLPVRMLVSAALGLALFAGMVFVGGVVLALLVA